MSYEDYLIREATGQGKDFMEPEPVEPNDSNETGDQQGETSRPRRFKLGKYGLAENVIGKHIALNWKGRRLLGEVLRADYNDTRGYTMLTVRHFNGELWPIQPAVSVVEIIG